MFSRSDKGICWMAGEGDDPRIVASAFVDALGAETVVARARVMREEYGNVTGHAIGQQPESGRSRPSTCSPTCSRVVPADEEKVWNEKVAGPPRRRCGRRSTAAGRPRRSPQNLKPHGVAAGRGLGHDRPRQGHHPPRHRPRRHHHRYCGA